MKTTRTAVFAAAIFACLILIGCGGGAVTHKVVSPWYGDLYGVATSPADQDINVPVDAWIHVYWPDASYPPPANFTVTLEKQDNAGNWGGIHTTLSNIDSNPLGGSWWFEPDNLFSQDTWYRITIAVPGKASAIAEFHTVGIRSAASSVSVTTAGNGYRPARNGKADGESAVVHMIVR